MACWPTSAIGIFPTRAQASALNRASQIQRRVQLAPYNSFGVPAVAAYFANIGSLDELRRALEFARDKRLSVQILGGGSNVLYVKDYEGLICHMNIRGISHLPGPGVVRASCGENWHEFVSYCMNKSLHGYENLALIPGSIGAAPIQNIGAYGVDLAQFLVELEVLDSERDTVRSFSRAECEFGYRDSIFKRRAGHRYVVLSASFELSARNLPNLDYQALKEALPNPGVTPRQIYDTVCRIRRSRLPDPAELGNAGSFFKNPVVSRDKYQALQSEHGEMPSYATEEEGLVKIPAAWLLDRAGWKGRRRGPAAVHEKHALVLVNSGGANGEDILLLAQEMSSSIQSQFGIGLVPEVQLI